MHRHIHRTTITLPSDLREAVDDAIRSGAASNRNDFIIMAIEGEIRRQRRAAIDAAMSGMASDSELHEENEAILREFEAADRETWEILDGER